MSDLYLRPRIACAVALLALTTWACGCAHKKSSSAPKTTAITGSNLNSSGNGRSVFTSNCAQCHALPSIGNYSLSQWTNSIIPSMASKAGLSSSDKSDLQNYITSVINGS